MHDVARVKSHHACDPLACFLGIHFLAGGAVKYVATLKGVTPAPTFYL
jgi:hypothetical protein